MDEIIASLHPLERKVFPLILKHHDFSELVKASGLQEIEVMRASQWLSNKKLIELHEKIEEKISLDKNGLEYSKKGLPEKRFLQILSNNQTKDIDQVIKEGISQDEINVSIGTLKQKGAIDVTKNNNKLAFKITENGHNFLKKPSLEEQFLSKKFPIDKDRLSPEEKYAFDTLMKRKNLVKLDVIKIRRITLTELGEKLSKKKIEDIQVIEKLTPEILKKGEWKNQQFRPYDVTINVPKNHYGKRHYVNQSVRYMKQIWLDMGFTEMTGNCVQTSFWDLDALFVPQDHPARTMQDTFFIKDPANGKLPLWHEEVKRVHENGGDTGSLGWGGKWDKHLAAENLLRTHTTVLSAQYINKIKTGEVKMPAKFFSVNKVFRNEQVDWKHLFEFNQVEGIVIDPDTNLENLKGYLREFFSKMGLPDVRLKPSHFPYTEPSLEVDAWNPVKKEWVEIGGAGIFRPEVTKTLIGVEVPVLAWGLGMERIITEYFEIKDLRDLYTNDLKQMKEMKMWMK